MVAAGRKRSTLLARATSADEAGGTTTIEAKALDHVAVWVNDRDKLAAFLYRHLGMHEIERTEAFTLVGVDARRGKLTLFAAEGEREAGVLGRVVLRISDLDRALGELPPGLDVDRPDRDLALFDAPEGLRLGLTSSPPGGVDYDIDHVVLRVPDPSTTFAELSELGFTPHGESLSVADKRVELVAGNGSSSERPLLNHVALLVDSGKAQLEEARRRGLEVTDIRDTENTFAVFILGPDGISLEYVEHKPTFSLV